MICIFYYMHIIAIYPYNTYTNKYDNDNNDNHE